MITGDYHYTAVAIAKKIGMIHEDVEADEEKPHFVLKGEDMAKMNQKEISKFLE